MPRPKKPDDCPTCGANNWITLPTDPPLTRCASCNYTVETKTDDD